MKGRRRPRSTAHEGEQKLRAVAEALPDLLFVLDENGTYIEALSSSKALLYARADQLVGRRMHDVLPRASADLFLKTVRRTLRTGKSQILEYALAVPAGPRYFEGRTSPLRGAGRPRRVVWISRDVTERRLLEERLREQVAKTGRAYRKLKRTQEQLVRSEKFASVGMLIANVAHELNNPLNIMYGNLKLLREGGRDASDPRTGRMLEDAMRAAERARSVMNEFRNFSRDVRSAEFADLNECLQEALSQARVRATAPDPRDRPTGPDPQGPLHPPPDPRGVPESHRQRVRVHRGDGRRHDPDPAQRRPRGRGHLGHGAGDSEGASREGCSIRSGRRKPVGKGWGWGSRSAR
jgi:PAS domain S-box-containing protein